MGGGGDLDSFPFFCCMRIHFVSLGYKQLEITLTACSISRSTQAHMHTQTHTHHGDFNFNLWNCNCLSCTRQRIVGMLSANTCFFFLFYFIHLLINLVLTCFFLSYLSFLYLSCFSAFCLCLSSTFPVFHSPALKSVCLIVMRRAGRADIKLTGAVNDRRRALRRGRGKERVG